MAKAKKLLGTTKTTQTIRPSHDGTGRVKQAWGNAAECADQWAANHYREGRSGNVSFNLGVFKSYNAEIARHVGSIQTPSNNNAVFVTTRTWSVTTSSHVSDVRHAIPAYKRVFNVPDVMADTVDQHRINFENYRTRAMELVEKAERARTLAPVYRGNAADLVKEANEYAEYVSLPDIMEEFNAEQVAAWKEKAEKELAAKRKREEIKNRAETRKRLKLWEEELTDWRDGESDIYLSACPDRKHPLYDKTLLRVTKTDKGKPAVLETSGTARVPFKAALPLLKVIRGQALAFEAKIGEFDLAEVNMEKRTVKVGCHTVDFDEIERLAAELGL